MTSYLFTSESVSEGHPDKVADQISDAVLDAILAQDKRARVACETMVKTGVAIVAGEITTSAWVDIESITRKVINDIGYTNSEVGFDGAHLRRPEPDRQAVAGHQPGRRPQESRRTGRGRPGPDVRLRDQRNARHDAGGDLLFASPRRAAGESAQGEEIAAAVAAPGREVAGHAALRERQGRRDRRGRAVDAARSFGQAEGPQGRRDGARHQAHAADQVDPQGHEVPHQPDRQVRRSADPSATAASPAARSSSTPTAAGRVTAAARSRARIRRRSIARRRMRRAMSPRTSSPPASRIAARSRSATRSASRIRRRSR